jgi:hypothetical protein
MSEHAAKPTLTTSGGGTTAGSGGPWGTGSTARSADEAWGRAGRGHTGSSRTATTGAGQRRLWRVNRHSPQRISPGFPDFSTRNLISPEARVCLRAANLPVAGRALRPLVASLLLSAGLALGFGSAASAGVLERACNASPQQSSDRNLCGCIQQVADLTLSGREQKLAAGFFKDPQKAQVMRQSARRRDEKFWGKYKVFGEYAALYCS